ncbi:MAG TPA: cytochrome d ubiquinol oxidase subunit II [Gemmatimonadaceae bacterium]
MTELWFGIVAVMLTMYVVMDGFDLGAGVMHLFVARTDEERRQVLAAIGPHWDANEVWLLATGGALFTAFPKVLASGLSGFYLAIFMVIWSLLLRGIAIEFRSHVSAPMWRTFWDGTFAVASILLCIFFGCALGNLLRGLPLDGNGWFGLTLFTDFSARMPVGILDWYTVLVGVYALIALVMQGGAFLCWKTEGDVFARSRRLAFRAGVLVTVLWPLMTFLTVRVNPAMFANFAHRPLAWTCALIATLGLVVFFNGLQREAHRRALLGSSLFLLGLLAATASSIFPVMLRSAGDPALSLTVYSATNTPSALKTALTWWLIGIPLVAVYFIIQFRIHAGKVSVAKEGHGY